MSHKATAWLSEVTGLSASEFRVLFHLCDCHNPSRGCFPTQAFLSDRCEMAGSTLNAALSSLEEKGLISRVKRTDPATKKQLSTLYRFPFEDKPTPDTGDGADSDFRGEPTPIYDESRLRPTGDKPVKGTSKEPVSASALFDFGDQPKPKTEAQQILEALMIIIPEKHARDFIAHRRALKKPMTVRAAELIAAKLARASNPIACVEKSITGGWQDVFPDDKPPEVRRTQDATDRFLGLA